ncbi:MAG: B12-binding domain-containing radical SAM protein [Anaerolineae bacterium]
MTQHRVILYNPQAVFYTMPLAVLAVGSYLDPQRYDVRIVDGRLERDPVGAVLAEIDDALCLGVTVLTGGPIRDALRVTRAAKSRRPDLPVIWGGWHPSLFPTETLKEPSIDITVQGQGEETFAEILDRLATGNDPSSGSGQSLADVAGCAFKPAQSAIPNTQYPIPNTQPKLNPPRPLHNTNTFPPHNYTLIPVERYFALKGQRQLDYIASQGCRFRCTFCADPHVYKRGWFGLEPARMGEELARLWRRYHFDDVGFQDETFFTYHKRVEAIAEEFLHRRLGFTWMATMRADQGDRLAEEVLGLCRRAGLRRVMIGVEAGSQQMLDWMKKDITLAQVFASAEKCRRQGIAVLFNLIVGFPDEPAESIRETLRVAKELRAMSPDFEVAIFYYKPYPGNEIAAMLLRQGYQFPRTLAEWAGFDYVGSSGPWVDQETRDLVEGFKFYQRIAWSRPAALRAPLQAVARWRCERDFYAWPVEKAVIERLRPLPRLS